MGKLGSPIAACLAHKGYRVHGVDVAPAVIDAVNEGRAPVFEPGLDVMINNNKSRLTAGNSIREAILLSDISFIVVATPSEEMGGFSLKYVKAVCEEVAQAIREKSGWHLVVLASTVMPGATQGEVVPILQEVSGKKCGVDFGLCYSPEFIALGTVLHDYLNPDFALIGESDKKAGDVLESVYMQVCDNKPRVARMNFINAELAKLSVNTFVTTKISFSNTLARVCENLHGANVDVVSEALGLDTRIGNKYLKGAVGYGGPCFPRDTIAFAALARSVGVSPELAEATDRVNQAQVSILTELVSRKIPKNGRVAVLGLSYKPNTNVTEESQGVMLAQRLSELGRKVSVFDPKAMENAQKKLGGKVAYSSSLEDSISSSDVIVIMTPWEQFAQISPDAVSREGNRRVLIDAWRILDPHSFSKACDYIGLGMNSRDLGCPD
ncbi:UDP-glucose/GDP-mannose dehydrogenase family protein [Algiphilus sp. NNCM1]|nr:UDP-glucose/GDP-mannose dehydrogenase family protein [Algiphilus acroporae]